MNVKINSEVSGQTGDEVSKRTSNPVRHFFCISELMCKTAFTTSSPAVITNICGSLPCSSAAQPAIVQGSKCDDDQHEFMKPN